MKNSNYKKQTFIQENQEFLTGFTLIEILVAMVIFSIVLIAFLNLFTATFKNQQKVLDSVELLNSISFATEYTSRSLRMAQKDIKGDCIQKNRNFKITGDGKTIEFLNSQGECQKFFLKEQGQDKMLWVEKSGVGQALTSSKIIVENLKFSVVGETQDDTLQPKVTFVLKIKTKKDYSQAINIQTSVSQRSLDVAY